MSRKAFRRTELNLQKTKIVRQVIEKGSEETGMVSIKSTEVWLLCNFQGCKWLYIAIVEGILCMTKGCEVEVRRFQIKDFVCWLKKFVTDLSGICQWNILSKNAKWSDLHFGKFTVAIVCIMVQREWENRDYFRCQDIFTKLSDKDMQKRQWRRLEEKGEVRYWDVEYMGSSNIWVWRSIREKRA